jgi:hypothetical protein
MARRIPMRTGHPIPPLTLTDAERETLERYNLVRIRNVIEAEATG